MRDTRLSFVRQQGYREQIVDEHLFAALMLQPRIIGVAVAIGAWLQSAWIFLALSAVLWWATIIPTHNLFNAIYNVAVADRRGFPPLVGAPAPRRFAMGVAAIHLLVIAVALLAGAVTTAWIAEGLFGVALVAVIFARRCAGASLYYLLSPSFTRVLAIAAALR
jgi:hypothetical protein